MSDNGRYATPLSGITAEDRCRALPSLQGICASPGRGCRAIEEHACVRDSGEYVAVVARQSSGVQLAVESRCQMVDRLSALYTSSLNAPITA